MGTPSLRVRLVFEDRSMLSKTQRSDGMNRSWLLLKLQQHRTFSDVCTHLLRIFRLHRTCPNGILLSMEGFTLPPSESTEILKDKEIICVKKKGGTTPFAGNLLDDVEDDELEPGDDGILALENSKFNNADEHQTESEEVDEEQSEDDELLEQTVPKKRKAPTNLQNLKKKKQCLGMLDDDEDEDEANIKAATCNKKVKSSTTVKRCENLTENIEKANQASKRGPSRNARRKKAKRQWMHEIAKIAKKKPQAYSEPEVITKLSKPENKEPNGQPKGLLYWKQASENPVQNGDVGPIETYKRNGSNNKKKVQKQGREKFTNFKRIESRRISKESFKMMFKDAKVPVIDIKEFDNLPPCSQPKEGDVIAYRLLELNSSWIPEFSSFRVGRISYYDAKDIVLIPVPEYPIASENVDKNGLNESLYGEDGCLEINYSALVDVRTIMQYDPNAIQTVNNVVNQTLSSKNAAENLVSNVNVKRSSGEGEVSLWDRFSSKNIETPEPKMNTCTFGGAGPSTSTGPDANKAESSGVKEGQNGNLVDPWLSANKLDSSHEKTAPTEDGCGNASSWGRPWSAFVVSRGSSRSQAGKESEWRARSK